MQLVNRIFGNGIGAKVLVALTGIALSLFTLAHLSGHMLMFAGPDAINAYAAKLKSMGPLLWLARAGLLGVFVLHLYLAIKLNVQNAYARPEPYAYNATMRATFSSRYMKHTGALLFAFIVYHLAHFTLRIADPATNAVPAEDVYGMMIAAFSNPWISAFYIVAMLALALHLCHGLSSVFQTLGVYHANINPIAKMVGPVVATMVFIGYSSIPVLILIGYLK